MKWIYARLASICALCHKEVAQNAKITHYSNHWVHLGCAEADERRVWSTN